MAFNINIDFDRLNILPERLRAPEVLKVVRRELENTRSRLVASTGSGKDAHGTALKEYSSSYKKLLSDAGEGTNTDLTITGKLLGSMKMINTTDGAEIEFIGQHPPAKLLRAKGKKPSAKVKAKGRSGSGISNAALAGKLHSMGFTGWFEYDEKKDIERIEIAVLDSFLAEVSRCVLVESGAKGIKTRT